MPVLPISDGQGSLVRNPISILRSVMRDPNPDINHTRVAAQEFALYVADTMPKVELRLDAGLLAGIQSVELPGDSPAPRPAATASLILYFNLCCARHHPEHIGLEKPGFLLPSSRSTVRRAWREYSSVAHLWFATAFRPPKPDEELRAYLWEFLGLAETLRRRAESIFPHGQTKPLLDPEHSWKCPEDFDLPEVEIELPPLSFEILKKLIDEYKSHKTA